MFDTRLNGVESLLVRIDIGTDDPIVERPESPNKRRALVNERNEMPDQRVAVDGNPANSFDQSLEFTESEFWWQQEAYGWAVPTDFNGRTEVGRVGRQPATELQQVVVPIQLEVVPFSGRQPCAILLPSLPQRFTLHR